MRLRCNLKGCWFKPCWVGIVFFHFYSCLAGFEPRPSHLQSLFFTAFYNSNLQIYISNLGARPVLVRFWDYIFRIWITVWERDWQVANNLVAKKKVIRIERLSSLFSFRAHQWSQQRQRVVCDVFLRWNEGERLKNSPRTVRYQPKVVPFSLTRWNLFCNLRHPFFFRRRRNLIQQQKIASSCQMGLRLSFPLKTASVIWTVAIRTLLLLFQWHRFSSR
jgi:hypothetical protein